MNEVQVGSTQVQIAGQVSHVFVEKGALKHIVACGDASVESSRRRNTHVPTSTIQKMLALRHYVLKVSEHNASKICTCCKEGLEGMHAGKSCGL